MSLSGAGNERGKASSSIVIPSDLIGVKRDLIRVKRDLCSVKRDLRHHQAS